MGSFSLSVCLSVLLSGVVAQEGTDDAELSRHLTTLKAQVEDSTVEIGRREGLVLEMAGTLDRAAQSAPTGEKRQGRWTQAIELLDGFAKENPGHPREREFRLQAAVYRWAQGQDWRDRADLSPADPRPRDQAGSAVDDAIGRLRGLGSGEPGDVLSDNIRFRLARALADRADLDPPGSARGKAFVSEALALVEKPVDEPGLKGFSDLLKADLLSRSGRLDEAAGLVATAAKATPAPREREVFDVLVPVLIGQKKFAEAMKRLETSTLPGPAKELLLVRIRLAELASLPAGATDRLEVESDLFRRVGAMRDKEMTPEARLALLDLSGGRLEPDARQDASAWDALGAGYELRGDPVRAAAMENRAATRAESLEKWDVAAGYRLRGGGFLFQAGQFKEADELLSRVVDEPRAGAVRSRAGMLRALARGRALSTGLPGASTAAYTEALKQQIRDFPTDPITGEARWLLGALSLSGGDRAQAQELWISIPPGTPRWLDAQLAVAGLDRDALDRQLDSADRKTLRAQFQTAQQFLETSLKQASREPEVIGLSLALARLDLTPGIGSPEQARKLAEQIVQRNLTTRDRYQARLYFVIAMAQLGRYVEAERDAHTHGDWAEKSDRGPLIDAIRLIDRCASTSELDLHQRRFGLLMRLLLQPLFADSDSVSLAPEIQGEMRMRFTRALLFLGDDRSARASMRSWGGAPRTSSDALLRDLADTYNRLEAYQLAVDVQRLRSRNLTAGSPAWFEARYGLALAYYHSGQPREAAQLVDATAILHPDLGGGTLQQKFIRLRQRVGVEP